ALQKPALRFGSGQGEDVKFSDLMRQAKLFGKKKYKQAKTWAKEQQQKPGSEKKAAAVGAGVGAAVGITAELMTGGLTCGQAASIAAPAVAGAVTGYLVNRSGKKQEQAQQQQQDQDAMEQKDS